MAEAEARQAELALEADRLLSGSVESGAQNISTSLDGLSSTFNQTFVASTDDFTDSIDGASVNLAFAGIVGLGLVSMAVLLNDK